MNLCEALQQGELHNRAVRRSDWAPELAWYHGMNNQLCWWNPCPDGFCTFVTGDIVSLALADFRHTGFQLHPAVPYHGPLGLNKDGKLVLSESERQELMGKLCRIENELSEIKGVLSKG